MSEDLKKEITQLKDHIKGLTAQFDAAKAMVNDSLQTQLQIRANLNIFIEANKEAQIEINKLRSTVDTLTKQILTLSPPNQGEENAANP